MLHSIATATLENPHNQYQAGPRKIIGNGIRCSNIILLKYAAVQVRSVQLLILELPNQKLTSKRISRFL